MSEFAGVLSFAVALLWLIALATYNPADPVWFFTAGLTGDATNLAGRAGAFLAYLSNQALGYAAYLFPVLVTAVGWCRFWCTPITAPYTKAVGGALLLVSTASFLDIALGPVNPGAGAFEPGGWIGAQFSGALVASFNRTGSLIIILTALGLSLVLTTRFSFGRVFGATQRVLTAVCTAPVLQSDVDDVLGHLELYS